MTQQEKLTFIPGWKLYPLCRTKTFPAITFCPKSTKWKHGKFSHTITEALKNYPWQQHAPKVSQRHWRSLHLPFHINSNSMAADRGQKSMQLVKADCAENGSLIVWKAKLTLFYQMPKMLAYCQNFMFMRENIKYLPTGTTDFRNNKAQCERKSICIYILLLNMLWY